MVGFSRVTVQLITFFPAAKSIAKPYLYVSCPSHTHGPFSRTLRLSTSRRADETDGAAFEEEDKEPMHDLSFLMAGHERDELDGRGEWPARRH